MYYYNCPGCPSPVALNASVPRDSPATCPNCNTAITHKMRALNHNPYAGMTFVAPKRPKHGNAVYNMPGRSPAAPVRTAWPGNNLNANVTHIPSLINAAWTGAGPDKIRMAYQNLNPASGQMEGLMIDCPEAQGNAALTAHFLSVMMALSQPKKATDIAEATGEAAAALCILRKTNLQSGGTNLKLAGFTMEWGMHVHSGAGIDQIWRRGNEYLIVEAKGPNQILSMNSFMPPYFSQMSTRWIMHNLATMDRQGHTIAQDILNDLALVHNVRWPNHGGGSKNYYGVSASGGIGAGRLFGVVVTSVWKSDGMLDYVTSNFKQYTNLTF